MSILETVYLGHDNYVSRILQLNSVAYSLAAVTRITLTVGTKLIDSDNGASDPIRWFKDGYSTGEVRFYLGAETITAGSYSCPLVIYDATNTTGIVWDTVPIQFVAELEATGS
jgi:hypothetical protein